MSLRVALVGGPMYDGLYRMLEEQDVEVVVHADHPTLNRAVAERLGRNEHLDVISTHSKYAPSQARWLRPLDALIDAAVIAPLAPKAVELCTFEGRLLAAPRNIDVRVLWANRRLLAERNVPTTWAELVDSRLAFGFPGRESGLFGTFFEIVTVNGGSLFDASLRPTLQTPIARQALQVLVQLAAHAPPDLPDWHYDQVDAALADGRVALSAAWPGATGALRSAKEGANLEPHPYLSGPLGLRSYGGCHAWAIPQTCADLEGAVRLLERLCSTEANALEAASGAVCAHVEVFGAIRGADGIDARRLEITRRTIADMITYPPLVRFPEIEDAGWGALHKSLRRDIDVDVALAEVQKAAEQVLAPSAAL